MANKTNQYGNVIADGVMDNGVSFQVAQSSNPFGESYLIITIENKLAAGIIVEKKKTGTIEIRNKVDRTVRIAGGEEVVEPENNSRRTLD